MAIGAGYYTVFTVIAVIVVIMVVLAIVIPKRLKRGSDLVIISNSNSFDPNFVFEQSYYAGLNQFDRRFYNALPSKYKLRVLQEAKRNNMDDVRKINSMVAFNIAVEAKKVVRSTTGELVADSIVESIDSIMKDESIMLTKDASFKVELEGIANELIPISVKVMGDAIDNSWNDTTVRSNLKTQLTLASNNAINDIVVAIEDSEVKTQRMTQLTSIANTMIDRVIADLITRFPIELANNNEAVFSTAGAMGFVLSYSTLDGTVVLDVKPVVYIVDKSVVVDINATCDETIERVGVILEERVQAGTMTRDQANAVLTNEREHIRDYLEKRVKSRTSIAFVAANIAVNTV